MGPLGSNEKMKRAKKTEPNKTPPERTRTSRRILDLSKNLQETKTTDMLAVTLAANVADSADDYPNGGESIRFSLQPTGGREPVWFMHLLSLFNCDSIPKSLFSRASKPSTEWNSDGELIHFDLDCLTSIRPDFSDIVRDDPVQWQQRYTSNLNRKQDLADHIDSEDLEVEGLEIFSKETQLSILAIIVSAWPEPWCEIVWEAVEEELWEVVESTCLPLLGVVSMDEIEEFLSRSTLPRMSDAFFESIQQDSEQQEKTIRNTDRSRAQLENNQAIRLPEGSEVIMEDFYTNHKKGHYMFTMLKFLVRLTLLLKFKTPPNVFSLISRGFYLLGDSWNEEVPSPDLEYLRLLRSIAEILILEGHPHIAAHKLQALDHGGSMRSNAAIAFALGSLSPSRIVSSSGEFLKWSPISPTAPSTMEILAQAQLLGAISLTKLPGISWEILSLETKVEVAFCEAKKKAFANASEILNQHVNEIEEKYGAKSLELLLIGTVLINCWNAAGQEANGERFGRHIWTNIFGTFNVDTTVEATHQVYLMVAMADSFLGQGKYNEARRMLVGVLEYPVTDSNLTMSTTLRLLKISRRLKQQATLFDDWTRLKKAVKNFDALSDTLKYECIEETVCLLSTLEPKDIPQIPQASDVVKILSRYCIDTYQGSNSSGVNLLQNMEEIQRFKSKLNLFSLSGPQLFYCRKMRERFSSATVPLVEKVGSANWQRFKRIKEMRETIEEVQVEARIPPAPLPAKSVFQDSGLGSSIGSDPMLVEPSPEQIPEVARSITSIRSFMSHQEGATSLPPIPAETPKGERTCFICEKSIKDIKNESQWRRHAFADLRPYVCIVEECDADHMKFASRAEFAAHLTEHQHTKLWTCKKCGQTNSKRALIHTNIACAHPSLNSENHEGAIAETTLLRELSKQKCPFCDEVPGATKFVGHLCHHLEEISLSAVPRDADMEDENDGNSTQRSSLKSMSERNLEIGIQHVEHNSETDNSIASELLQFEQKLEEMVMSNNIPAIEAAGEEPDTIKCICDFLDDVGDTIYCGRCKTRQHVECYYPGLENGIFEHSCADCRPRPLDRNQANERHQYLLQRPTNPGTSISKTSLRPKAGRLSTKQQLEMNESSEKSHKPNLWKCKPCYDAGEKCFPEGRAWPEKCYNCLQRRPEELECSVPLLVRKIQRDLLKTTRRSKTRSTSDSQEFRRRETDDDLSEDDIKFLFRNRPVLTAAMPKIKREHPGSSEPVTESHQPPFVGKDDRHLSSGRQESRGRESDDKSSSDETLFYDGPVRPTLSPRSSEPFLKTRSGNAAAPGNTQEQIRLGTLEETVKKLVEADKRSPEQATEKEVGGSSLSYPKNLHRTYDLPMVNGGMPPPHYYHEGLARVRKRGRPSKADLIARAALRDKADLIARATLRGGVDKSRSEQATGKEAGGSSLSRPKNQYQTNDPPMISRDILPKPPYPSLPLAGSVKKRGRPSKADAIARGDKVDKSSSEQATGKEAGGSSLSRTENQQLSNNPLRNVLDILPKPPNPPEALGGSARKRGRPSKADLIARTALRDKIDKSSPEQATEKEAGGSSLSRPKNQHQTNDPPMIHHGILPIPAFPPEAEALALAGSVWKRGRPSKADAIAHGDITPPPNA